MKKIPLTQNKYALVDDNDYEFLNQYKWTAVRGGNGGTTFYAVRTLYKNNGKKTIRMHSLILKPRLGEVIDHINGNGLDNRRSNIRSCSQTQNMQNTKKRKDNTSGYKGVGWNKFHKKWMVRIQVAGKRIQLGYYSDLKEAVLAYNSAARKYHGSFARLNKLHI